MTDSTQRVLDAALELPEDERAELAAILLDSIGDDRAGDDVDEAWLVEVRRRLEAVRSGQATLVPTEQVERELDELLQEVPETRRAG